ncbi:hypothetical protein Btru_068932 [Bulinus truncatus]|nr:hypothetical protein Btru_068932 [Bulinus truncatus]
MPPHAGGKVMDKGHPSNTKGCTYCPIWWKGGNSSTRFDNKFSGGLIRMVPYMGPELGDGNLDGGLDLGEGNLDKGSENEGGNLKKGP